ncbi:MAG: ABC transporter substrate-binding protein [Acetatifactor sp.]|nr:ABC transporter substrate-binding protein [Acetatifactor sp.]
MKKYISVLLTSLVLTILSACGQPGDVTLPSESETEGEAAQWKTEGFATPGKLENEQIFWTEQYLPWEHKSTNLAAGAEELIHLDYGVCGELFWHLGLERVAEDAGSFGSEAEYILEIYDTVGGECTVKRFSPGELGLEVSLGYLESMDMLDGEHYVFRWVDWEQDQEGMYCQNVDRMVYTDLANGLQIADVREIYLEKGICQEVYAEQRVGQSLNWRCDGKGNICVIDYREDGSRGFYLFGQNGEILLEYEGTSKQNLVDPLRTPEGELILPVYDEKEECYEFLWADAAEGELRSLARVETSFPYIGQMYGMLGDDIYYRSQAMSEEGIVKWNIKSGRRVQVFDFQTAGLDTSYRTMLALREGQTPVLRLTKFKDGKPREWIATLAQQRPADDGAIRVANLAGDGYGPTLTECAVLASMETPDYRYEYEDASAQEARDRILIELSQGKGPDLMFVSPEDMRMLEEKGLLLDIGQLIPGELQEDLLPGAMEIGTVDDRFLGMPMEVTAQTLAVAADTWPEDTWRLEDVIDLMDEGKLTGAIRSPYVGMNDYVEPSLTVLTLIRYSLEDSFLIDWEKGESHFDDERFIRLLELTGTDMSGIHQDTDAWLNEGKDFMWGYFPFTADFLNFFAHMEEEGGRIVGFPTEGACGSYLEANGVLVVNANIAHKEAAAYYLETLLGDEVQLKISKLGLSVRKLSPENYIVEEEDGRLVYLGGLHAPEMPVFQDGTTSIHRAKTFLESCAGAPPRNGQITRIIVEELSAMYAENKPPQTAAEIIDSRVQLYLDERK